MAGWYPNHTLEAPAKLDPVITTFVPPDVEPLEGDSAVTTGLGR